ncbi:DinB family protein [Flavobacterium nackdongense]|uniref:DinB family protein n=1 Tax=Flavobacterium nackdongense TaxID=2547394 RepID=A0A4P6YG80_9FLAO|nr:DinB family protein [Flavobacterium nackdongense]QBN19473.1 DinB family protein [Flavobacterium nackdongense]
MHHTLEVNTTSRKMALKFLENYSLEQLNKIPEGFSNNLIWNIGHILVTQQLLVYKLSGLPMMVSDDMVEKFKKGSKPEQEITQTEVEEIKSLLFVTIEKTNEDLKNNVFKEYQEYPTSTGFVLKNAEGAMAFNNFHEGLHLGIMMSLRKLV